jgi:type II secretory pathway pseudopilin PulG
MPRTSPRPSRAGFGLLETLIAVAVVASGVVAVQRLVARSVATLGEDLRVTRGMLAAQTLLADAALAPPEPGHTSGSTPEGLRFERDVARTPHPALREVRVRVWPDDGAAPCELWEVVHVPPA